MERYTIEGMLGTGGMASVYLARHNQLGSLHAIKVLQVLTPSIRERLLQEGRVQGAMRHPHIVAVTDLVEVDGTPALVLEYVRGPSLAQLLAKRRPSLAQADQLARGILRGTAFAHKHGLIHRDLKPGNILLAIRDGELAPKITDFGLAKIVQGPTGRHETRTGVGLGTPSFMAPEQIRDAAHVDHRADVFSLGAILFQLVTGQLCFDGADKMETFTKICDGQYPNPRRLVPDLPERMVRAIEEALRVEAEQRPEDAGKLLAMWTGSTEGLDSDPLVTSPGEAWTEEILRSAEALAPTDESLSAAPAPSGEPTFAVSLDFTPAPAPKARYVTQPSLLPDPESTSLAPTDPTRQALVAAAAAALVGTPFLFGSLVLVFGSAGGALLAPGAPLFFAMGLIGLAAAGAFAVRHPTSLAAWLVVPASMALLGNSFSARRAQEAHVLVDAAPLSERAVVAASGVAEALAADMAAITLTTFVLLAVVNAAAFGAVRVRGQLGPLMSPRRLATAAVAVLGSSGLWLASLAQDDGPGPFVLFTTLFVCGLACAAIAFPREDDSETLSRDRVLVGIGTATAILSAAKVLYLQQVAYLFSQVRAGDGDQLAVAEQFASALAEARMEIVALWGGAALLTSLVPFAGIGRPRRLPWVRELGLIALLATPLLLSKWTSDNAISALASEVLPAFVDAESARVVGMRLADGEDLSVRLSAMKSVSTDAPEGFAGATVVDPGTSGLLAGDILYSLENQPIAGVRALLETLSACECGSGGACSLASCIDPGARVQATVLRQRRLEAVQLPVLFGQEAVAASPILRFTGEGLSLDVPEDWGLTASRVEISAGTLVTLTSDADAPVQVSILDHQGFSELQSLDAFAEGQLQGWVDDPANITSQTASSRVVMGVPSEARAVTVAGEAGTEYLEFHRVSAPDHKLLLLFAVPSGQHERHRAAWEGLLDSLSAEP